MSKPVTFEKLVFEKGTWDERVHTTKFDEDDLKVMLMKIAELEAKIKELEELR